MPKPTSLTPTPPPPQERGVGVRGSLMGPWLDKDGFGPYKVILAIAFEPPWSGSQPNKKGPEVLCFRAFRLPVIRCCQLVPNKITSQPKARIWLTVVRQ